MKIEDTLFHKTLIAAGFTYQYNKIPPGTTLHWKHNWSNGEIYFCAQEPTERVDTETDWVSRIIQTSEPSPYHGQSSAEIIAALKKDPEVENNKITPDNIEEVLRYNDIPQSKYSVFTDGVRWYYGCKCHDEDSYVDCRFGSSTWLAHLELETGKLKPLPEFAFEDYLKTEYKYASVERRLGLKFQNDGTFTTGDYDCKFNKTRHNADCLIEACQVLEGLE